MASPFSGKAGRKAAMWTIGFLDDKKNEANQLIDQGAGRADALLQEAGGLYQPLAGTANRGYGAYADAAGANGAEGYGRARASFQTDPGYRFQMDQGLDAINRTAAARGMLAGGNNTVDLLKYAQGLADQSWGNYVSRLAPYLQQAPAIAGAQSALLGTRAGLQSDAAGNKADVLLDIAGQQAGAGQQGMMAGQQAAANRFGAIMGGANLAAKLLGSALGGGRGGSKWS
jgi:hypothetical protein